MQLTEHSVKKGTKRQFIGMKLALDKYVSKKKIRNNKNWLRHQC